MSKVVYACSRSHSFSLNTPEKLTAICNALVPDNLHKHPEHTICVQGALAYAVSMRTSALQEAGLSLLLGCLFEEHTPNWEQPRSAYPDGNFALFRVNDEEIEVVSDGAGTRTIWYYHDAELFLASTSQRAIIMFLGDFHFDERAIAWFLSTGSLGPQLSWDKRLQRTQAGTSVLLDRKTWALTVQQPPTVFSESPRHPAEHTELLTTAIKRSIKALGSLDFKQWVLPLSGGYDSRAIVCFIKDCLGLPVDLKAVTWGLKESVNEDGNDARVARDLARCVGVQHEYYHTDLSSEPIEKIVDRFIFCSEGRIDNIAGYMDGMDIWRRLCESGITGIIRGDEGFGWVPVSSDLTVRLSVGCGLCSDFKNVSQIMIACGLPSQELPADLTRHEGETLDTWRDRLYHAYRLPSILAALSDIKFSYVEQINPLLSTAILKAVRSMPDNLRTDKTLFKSIVDAVGPRVPFARKGANASPKNILRHKPFADFLKAELAGEYAINLLGTTFAEKIRAGINEGAPKPSKQRHSIKQVIASLLPAAIKDALRATVASPTIDGNMLAFRVLMIVKMHKMLTADAGRPGS